LELLRGLRHCQPWDVEGAQMGGEQNLAHGWPGRTGQTLTPRGMCWTWGAPWGTLMPSWAPLTDPPAGQDCSLPDACANNPCANGARCTNWNNRFNCTCPPGYQGRNCRTDVDECRAPGVCHHGGTCFNTPGSFRCQCPGGFTGQLCESVYTPCSPSQCLNGGTCRQTGELTYECACLPGEGPGRVWGQRSGLQGLMWGTGVTPACPDEAGALRTRVAGLLQGGHHSSWVCPAPAHAPSLLAPGLLCHLDDACVSNPCHEDAICDTNPVNGRAICTCPPGFTGGACDQDVDECSIGANPCEHFGRCMNTEGSFQCQCGRGYTGPRCETDINECLSMPCQNDATCLDRIGEFTCICMAGFSGMFCEINIDECDSNPCVNGGVCRDGVNGFTCTCPSGFSGSMCQIDIDECASTPCQNGAKCVDRPNAYECHCTEGFEGTLCEKNIDDCSPDPCHHGTCLDGIASFTCSCAAGYTGYRCENQINECYSSPCQNGGKCIDRINKYQCNCLPGTSGVNCEVNFDDCTSNPCDYGVCRDGINHYDCICKPGFTGPLCNVDINECASSPCQNGGTCMDGENGFTCLCPEGFHDPHCYSEVDECGSSPCVHGVCRDDVNGYSCECEPGWAGTNCDLNTNECESNPCQFGGTCTDSVNGYHCTCKEGFQGTCPPPAPSPPPPPLSPTHGLLSLPGTHCQTNVNDCVSGPCLNKGTCIDRIASYTCLCDLPYTGGAVPVVGRIRHPGQMGRACLWQVGGSPCWRWWRADDGVLQGGAGGREKGSRGGTGCCKEGGRLGAVEGGVAVMPWGLENGAWSYLCPHPCSSCFNGGTCLDGVNSYTCRCRPGFTGTHCQHEIDECQSRPCLNGGVCLDGVESYRCTCPQGYTGPQCQTLVDWCRRSPCQNGGRCLQMGTALTCECPGGWTGRYCDIPNVSCEVVAAHRGVSKEQVCHYRGQCVDAGNTHYCLCKEGYTGSYCESEIDHCLPNPCQHGATCHSFIGSYDCECPLGFEGKNCEYDTDECQSYPCQNGGSCIDLIGRYICSCPPGTLGVLCEINEDDCATAPGSRTPKCLNNGTCVDRVGGYRCNCPPGYTGERCEGDINECLSSPCLPQRTVDCVQGTSDFHCLCKPGYTGRRCQTIVNTCESQPCQNGGQCKLMVNTPLGYTCRCPPNYSGPNCERLVLSCRELACFNGGSCQHTALGARCSCPPGFSGSDCRLRANSSCTSDPGPPHFQCLCPSGFSGLHCELTLQELRCLQEECGAKAGDSVCDKECNSPACKWDGGDCSLRVDDPWRQCEVLQCWRVFNNSQCDEACNTAECLYDNFDCKSRERTCNPVYEKYCSDHFADGQCDQGCNHEECGWDGLDCAREVPEHLASGVLVITVLLPPEELRKTSTTFLQKLSAILHTSLRFRLDKEGNYMIEPLYRPSRLHRRELGREVIGSVVTLEIDNRLCFQASDKCFPDARSAADYLAALAAVERLEFPYPIKAVHSEWRRAPDPMRLLPLLVVAAVILLVILVLGVLVARRKREHSTLWFPEGFSLKKENSNKNRREPVGQDALGMKNISKGESLMGEHPDDWMDAECPEAKRLKVEEPGGDSEDPVDCRQWTQHHLVAADIRMPPSMALTPPQGEFDTDCMDVNVRGPDGFTPLMLASFCGGGVETDLAEEDEADDSSANIISDLICQGANLSAQTDRTGETALHLAARYARADAAKRLLDAGADTNAQDNTGRTPLHAAVTADAQGVFQILIRNRSTDLDARMVDGSTALILAARLAVEGMVEELIACHADVNAVDELGKSALHWAAAVNNVEATIALLKNGANKDMQDSKEETPLFLAAREGSYEAAKILLDHFANREITDHMDRLPRDIAQDRMHHDIVRLLDEYNTVRSPQGALPPGHTMSPLMCPPNSFLPSLKPTPQGKKSRRPSAKGAAGAGNSASLPKEAKGRSKKLSLECQGALMESSVTLSPVDSLDSPYVANPTSPVLASPGVFHPAAQSTILSMNRVSMPSLPRQPGCVGLSLGMVSPVAVPFDWHARVPTSQCNPVIGVVHPAASHPNLHQPAQPFPQGLLLSNHLAMVHGSQVLAAPSPAKEPPPPVPTPGQPMPPPPPTAPALGRTSQPISPKEGQGGARPGPPPPPQYYKAPGGQGTEDYPTPPSQHNYAPGQERTPKHYVHLRSEHPYLTPSPESPEQWASPSPHSLSDWSESTPSPVVLGPPQTQLSHLPDPATKMQVFA
uniref:Notch receptor 3 n=1 Tax=Pelusios castaneus TaxID=367368 RepID=A0A8C8SMG2_9SAUR